MLGGDRARRAVALLHPPAPGREPALRPRRRRPAHLLGRRVRGDHRLRLAHGRGVHQPAVPPERPRLLDARGRAAILPAALFMVLVAPRSAKLVEARGARFTLLCGYVFLVLGFLTMLLLWKEDIALLADRARLRVHRHRRRLRGTPASHSLTGSVPVTRAGHGVGHGRSPARPRRRDHAVDLRRAAHGGLRGRGGRRHRRLGQARHGQHAGAADEVLRRAPRTSRSSTRSTRAADHRRREDRVPPGRPVGLHSPAIVAVLARRRPRVLHVPEARRRAAPARGVPRRGHETCQHPGSRQHDRE